MVPDLVIGVGLALQAEGQVWGTIPVVEDRSAATRFPPLIGYEEKAAWVYGEVRTGRTVAEVARSMVDSGWDHVWLVRSLRDGAGLSFREAQRIVMDALDPTVREGTQRMWRLVENEVAALSLDDDLHRITDLPRAEWGDQEWIRHEVRTTVALETLRAVPAAESLFWIRRTLQADDRLQQIFACVVADRLNCPHQLVPDLLEAAEKMDASFCRVPLETIVRSHGPRPIEARLEILSDGSHHDRATAEKWRYWLNRPPTATTN